MKVFLVVALVFALLTMFLAAAAAVYAVFWSLSNIIDYGVAGFYATYGLLLAAIATVTSLIAWIVIAVAMVSKSTSKRLPIVALVFILMTFIVAILAPILAPLWMMSDIANYGILSSQPFAALFLGGVVGGMDIVTLIMLIVAMMVKPSMKGV